MCCLIYQLRPGPARQYTGPDRMDASAAFFAHFCIKRDIFCGAAQSPYRLQQAKKKAAASADTAALYTRFVSSCQHPFWRRRPAAL